MSFLSRNLAWALVALLPLAAGAADPMVCYSACLATPAGQSTPQTCLDSCGFKPSIDYRCVSGCVNNGGPGPTCVKQCSYYPDSLFSRTVAGDLASRHDQFGAPVPIGAGTPIDTAPAARAVTTPKDRLSPTTQPLSPSTDYKAMQLCLRSGLSFGYCLAASRY